MTVWFVAARALHFGTCLLLFSIFAFDRMVLTAIPLGHRLADGRRRQRQIGLMNLILLPLLFLSGLLWLLVVAITMSGHPPDAGIIETVWLQTEFGTVWRVRLILWLLAVFAAALYEFVERPLALRLLVWLELLLSAALLGSLAFAGHGLENSRTHLYADILHLLFAGVWPVGLLPFLWQFRAMRRLRGWEHGPEVGVYVRRFSAISLGSVALLAVTGLVNACSLVGSFRNLVGQPYGRWLLLKLVLFALAIAIGAINLLRLKPRLSNAPLPSTDYERTAAQLDLNVRLEIFLAAGVVVIVAILGILPPGMP